MLSRLGPAVAIMVTILMGFASGAAAQQMPNPYGATISLEAAKKVAAAAAAEALKNKWRMAIAITDPAGHLVHFSEKSMAPKPQASDRHRQIPLGGNIQAADQDIPGCGSRRQPFISAMKGAVPSEGGLPILIDGKIVGGIGASGGTSQQDGVVAKAGAEAVK